MMLHRIWSVVMALGVALLAGCGSPANTDANAPAGVEEQVVEQTPDAIQPKILGSPDAPVTVVEYADFQCIWCARAHEQVWPELEPLVNEGLVRFEYRHRIVLGPKSFEAAEASECAYDQGKFWQYLDVLYENYAGKDSLDRETLTKHAKTAGLDMEKFAECLDTNKYEEAVARLDQEAQDAGVRGTPSFFINGEQFRPQESLMEVVTAVRAAVEGAQSK